MWTENMTLLFIKFQGNFYSEIIYFQVHTQDKSSKILDTKSQRICQRYTYVYVFMYLYMYVYIYIYVYIYFFFSWFRAS